MLTFNSPKDYADFKEKYWSKENLEYMQKTAELETKYGTKKYDKLLDKMSDREYEQFKKLEDASPMRKASTVKKASTSKKAVDNSEKSDTIKSTKTKVINGTTVTNPMDRQKYLTMKSALERNGVKVIAAEGDDLAFLRSFGAEATYDHGYILHMGETPSASALFEEIIHWTQARKYGELEDTNPIELYAREIAANRMLLKNGQSYGFDEDDFADIRLNLPRWEERFKKAVGVSYDESEYNREI